MTLGLDPSGLKKGGREARQEIKDIKKDTGELSKSFKDLKGAIAEVMVAIGSMYLIKKTVLDIVNLDAGVSRLSKNLGMAPGKVMAWGNAMKTLGGTAEDANNMLLNIAKTQTEMRITGDSGMIPYLRALGVSLADTQGKALPASEVLLRISDRLQGMIQRQGRTTAYNFAGMMGFNDNQINMLLQGRKAVQGIVAEEERLRPFNAEQAKAAEKAQRAWANLGVAWQGVAQKVSDVLLPMLEKAMPSIQSGILWISNNMGAIKTGLAIFGAVVTGTVIAAIVSFVGALGTMAAAVAPVVWLVLSIVTALGTLGVMIYEATKDWDGWKKSIGDWSFWSDTKAALQSVKEWWDGVGSSITKATDAFGKWLDKQKHKARSTWEDVKAKGGEILNAARKIFIKDNQGNILETREGGHRNWRNNNPGNIEYGEFARSHGAIGSDGRFAVFRTLSDGYAAADALLKSAAYAHRSISQAVERWAPRSENNTDAYINAYRQAGFDVNKRYVDLSPAEQRRFLQTKMQIEGGRAGSVTKGSVSALDAHRAIQSARQAQIQHNNNQRTSQVETTVGAIHVHTPATDGIGVARDLRREILNNGLIAQADYGLA